MIVRYVGTDKQTTYVPGTTWWGPAPYGSMYGYWGYGWGAVYDPGYLQTDTIISLESLVYDVPKDKLIWASKSETTNPTSMQNLVNSLIDATIAEMKKQKGTLTPEVRQVRRVRQVRAREPAEPVEPVEPAEPVYLFFHPHVTTKLPNHRPSPAFSHSQSTRL